jgi:hypothetical protein
MSPTSIMIKSDRFVAIFSIFFPFSEKKAKGKISTNEAKSLSQEKGASWSKGPEDLESLK